MLKKNQKGFTIIEVLIVLAIAGLIMLIVFLAVPGLQRSSRNNGRKNDASHIAAAISNYMSNNNGVAPSTPANLAQITGDVGSMAQFSFSANNVVNAGNTMVAGDFNWMKAPAGLAVTPTQAADSTVGVYYGLTCPAGNQTTPNTAWSLAAGTTRSAALVFPVELSTGNVWNCISAL